ncbi:MAG: lysophospholipid acyltransferase family protein [Rhizobiaceae bacterium]
MIRNILFQVAYWTTSILVGIVALPLLIVPGRAVLMWWLRLYARTMVFWMRTIIGIEVENRGHNLVPQGPSIIAAKHQSWGDGFAMFSQFYDLAFVTGDHLEKIPVVGWILRKMQAVVVDSCGGAEARQRLVDRELAQAREQNRRILIYPEGQLVEPGYHARYKKGVFHMYKAYGCPVVPVATNLGLFWPKSEWTLKSGTAVVEFLQPIPPGLDKDIFMAELQDRIEIASLALLPPDFEVPREREVADADRPVESV